MDRARLELSQALRSLSARRGSALATSAILAIGLGFAALIFAITDPFLLKPLPYPHAGELAIVRIGRAPGNFFETPAAPAPAFSTWQSRRDLFHELAAYAELEQVRISTPGGAGSLTTRAVSPNFVSLLGGSSSEADWRAASGHAPRALAVDNAAMRRRGDLAALLTPGGPTLVSADGTRYFAAMSLPRGFLFPHVRPSARPEALIPAEFDRVSWRNERSTGYLTGIARLRDGITTAAVEAALQPEAEAAGLRVRVEPLGEYLSAGTRPLALGALAVCLLITLVCTANVMNLVIARSVYRRNEFATREALGASRASLLRLIVIELSIVAAAAASAGLLLARLGVAAIARTIPEQYAAIGEPQLTARVIAFTVIVAALVVAACTAPTWFGARSTRMADAFRTQHVDSRTVRLFRFLMAAGQTAAAMILLVAALFLARSYANLWSQDTGYAADARILSVSYPASRSSADVRERVETTLHALRRVPGVKAAAAAAGAGSLLDDYSTFGGARIRVGERAVMLAAAQVTPGYFSVAGSRMVAGRPFGPADRGWDAVVINEAFAARFWPGIQVTRIVGQTVDVNGRPSRVAGIVQNAHDRALDSPPAIRIYRPFDFAGTGPRRIAYALRVSDDSAASTAARTVRELDTESLLEADAFIVQRLAESVRDRTFGAFVLSIFAVAGVAVTATGIFAIVAFVVARRTREIAIRIALGAGARDVRGLVIRDAIAASLAGALTGLAVGRVLARGLESQMYGVSAGDATVPAMAAALMLAITAIASWVPARRALALDPARALRVE